jgi:hypothetical protein
MTRKPIIHNRRFWWLYPETGRMERIYANERLRSQISQHAAVEARVAKEEAPPRRTNHPPRPPGTMPTLPSDTRVSATAAAVRPDVSVARARDRTTAPAARDGGTV